MHIGGTEKSFLAFKKHTGSPKLWCTYFDDVLLEERELGLEDIECGG